MAVFEIRVWQEIGCDALVERAPGLAAIRALENTAYRYADIDVPGIRGIDTDRMHLGAVRPRKDGVLYLRIQAVVETYNLFPGDAVVVGTEQARRRRARIPDAGFGSMRGGKPEHAFHRTPIFAFGRFPERGGLLRLGPGPAAILRTKYRGSEMSGFRGISNVCPSRGFATR